MTGADGGGARRGQMEGVQRGCMEGGCGGRNAWERCRKGVLEDVLKQINFLFDLV